MNRAAPLPGSVDARLQALIAAHAPRIRTALRRARLERFGIAPEDVEQEVQVRLWKAFGRETELDRPASYLEQVIRTTVVDAVRRAAVRPPPQPDATPADTGDDATPDPARASAGAELVDHMRRILAGMTGGRATAVGLLLQGFTIPEIARLTQSTEAGARNLAYRALSDLRAKLAELGYDHEL